MLSTKSLVGADWLQKFILNKHLSKEILKRAIYLTENAKEYYDAVVKNRYVSVITKLHNEKLLYALTSEEIMTINDMFPNIIDENIFNVRHFDIQ